MKNSINKALIKIYKTTFYRLFENIWLFIFKIFSKNKEVNFVKNGAINN